MASSNKLLGIALVVIGVGLGIWGLQLSDSLGSQLNEVMTGSPTDKVMMLYIGGAASLIAGLYLLVKR